MSPLSSLSTRDHEHVHFYTQYSHLQIWATHIRTDCLCSKNYYQLKISMSWSTFKMWIVPHHQGSTLISDQLSLHTAVAIYSVDIILTYHSMFRLRANLVCFSHKIWKKDSRCCITLLFASDQILGAGISNISALGRCGNDVGVNYSVRWWHWSSDQSSRPPISHVVKSQNISEWLHGLLSSVSSPIKLC